MEWLSNFGLILAHIFLLTNGYSQLTNRSHIDQYINFISVWEDVSKAFLGYLIILGTVVLSITIVRKRLKYEWWYWVHLFNYFAYILFAGHQLNLGLSANSLPFMIYWVALYIFAFGNLGWYRFWLPVYRFYKHRFTISDVQTFPDSEVTNVSITGKKLERLTIQAGQFFIFRFLQTGKWYEAHPFSMSTYPTGQSIRITAKNLGDFTAKMPELKVGTKVLIDGPHGVFTTKQSKQNKVLLLAGGIGITPLRSLAEQFVAEGKDVKMIYGVKTTKDLVLIDELKQLSQNSNFKLTTCLSDQDHPDHAKGYIDQNLLTQEVPDLLERDVYLCGPPIMMDKLKVTLLKDLKLSHDQFHWERFAL
ncbi:MAG: ferredoxin reductase family protein [Candidatus Doudnabacteria bacterium]